VETRANIILVGTFIIAMIAAGLGFTYWLRSDALTDGVRYRILFTGPVNGLSRASTVLFNGIPVGRVARLGIYGPDTRKVVVTVTVSQGTPIRTDSTARIVQRGLTAQPAIQISAGTLGARLLDPLALLDPVAAANAPPTSAGTISADEVSSQSLLEAAPQALASANAAFSRINQLVASNEEGIGVAISNLRAFSTALDDNRQNVALALQQIGAVATQFEEVGPTLVAMRGLITRLDETVARNEAKVDTALASVQELTTTLAAQGDGIAGIVTDTRQAAAALTEIKPIITDLAATTQQLRTVISDNADGVTASVTSLRTATTAVAAASPIFTKAINDVAAAAQGARQLGPALESAGAAFKGLQELVDDNKQGVSSAVSGIAKFSATLEARADDFDSVTDDARAVAAGLRRTTGALETAVGDLGKTVGAAGPRIETILDDAGTAARNVAAGSKDLGPAIADARATIARMQSVVDTNAEGVGTVITGAARFASALGDNADTFTAIAADARTAAATLARTATKIETTVDQVSGMVEGDTQGAALIADLRGAIASFRDLSDKLNVAVGDNALGLTRTAKRSLQEIEQFAREAKSAARSFDRLAQQLERNPQSLIFGGSGDTDYQRR